MRGLFFLLLSGLVGFCLAMVLTQQILKRVPEQAALRIGVWQASPFDGAQGGVVDLNPYQKAASARQRSLSFGAGEGLRLYAFKDSDGAPLQTQCSYTISGNIAPSKHWTLSAVGLAAPQKSSFLQRAYSAVQLAQNAGLVQLAPLVDEDARFLNSSWVVWEGANRVRIAASSRAQQGNWLGLPATRGFMLVLRLYDPLDSFEMRSQNTVVSLPTIEMGQCK